MARPAWLRLFQVQCCFMPTDSVWMISAQDVHFDFHTAPELCSGRVCAAAFAFLISTTLELEVWHHYHPKCISCLLYFQTITLCSRQRMTNDGTWAAFSLTLEPNGAQLTSIHGRPSINISHSAQKCLPVLALNKPKAHAHIVQPWNVCQCKRPQFQL